MSEVMNEQSPAQSSALLTRRAFVNTVATAAAALAIAPSRLLLSQVVHSSGPREIVSFHMDQPYLDRSGTAVPYYPPPGARSGEAVAHLTEEAFRRSHVYA